MATDMTLPEKQRLFGRLFFQWGAWVNSMDGVSLVPAEGWVALTDGADGDYDGPHKQGGAHYNKLGHDVDLWVRDQYIADGAHPLWLQIGEQWERMHPLCRWGGRFSDANHVSLEHEGVK